MIDGINRVSSNNCARGHTGNGRACKRHNSRRKHSRSEVEHHSSCFQNKVWKIGFIRVRSRRQPSRASDDDVQFFSSFSPSSDGVNKTITTTFAKQQHRTGHDCSPTRHVSSRAIQNSQLASCMARVSKGVVFASSSILLYCA